MPRSLKPEYLKGILPDLIAVLAQLVERLVANQKAAGSNPAYRTIFFT